jgi:hypothetical protein
VKHSVRAEEVRRAAVDALAVHVASKLFEHSSHIEVTVIDDMETEAATLRIVGNLAHDLNLLGSERTSAGSFLPIPRPVPRKPAQIGVDDVVTALATS